MLTLNANDTCEAKTSSAVTSGVHITVHRATRNESDTKTSSKTRTMCRLTAEVSKRTCRNDRCKLAH